MVEEHEIKPEISICIPVYNQQSLLQHCLAEILKYTGNDIEVVVQDNCSTEDIAGLVRSYNDQRIRYFRNPYNMGLDLNILQSFRNARSHWAFILRTKDWIIPEAIPLILDRIRSAPNASLITGNAVFPDGSERMTYQITRYRRGAEAIAAHNSWHYHAFGNAYRLDMLDLDAIEQTIRRMKDPRISNVIHYIARIALAQSGDYELINENIWVYSETRLSEEPSVISLKNARNINSPRFARIRYGIEMLWVSEQSRDHKLMQYEGIFSRYLTNVTVRFSEKNRDPLTRAHYKCKKEFHVMWVQRCLIAAQTKILANKITYNKPEEKKEFLAYCREAISANKRRITPFLNKMHLRKIANHLKCRKEGKTFIYGAGFEAKRLLEVLHKKRIPFDCIIVTKNPQEQQELFGHTVFGIDQVVIDPQKDIVVLAVTSKLYRLEMLMVLHSKGIQHIVTID